MGVVFDEIADLLHFGGGHDFGNFGINVAVLVPLLLSLEDLGGHDVIEAELARRVGVFGRGAGVLVHGQREVAVDEADLAGCNVL